MFQSLIGELKTWKFIKRTIIKRWVSIPHRRAKNRNVGGNDDNKRSKFQSLIGELKTWGALEKVLSFKRVSIPHRRAKNN